MPRNRPPTADTARSRDERPNGTRQDKRANARRRLSTNPNPSGTANPKAHRRHSRRSCIRPDKRANVRRRLSTNPSPSGTADPKAHRRHSRRSSTRPVKRAHARLRPRTRLKPKRHSRPKSAPAAKPPQLHPLGQTRPRETKGLNNRSQQDKPTHASLRA